MYTVELRNILDIVRNINLFSATFPLRKCIEINL